MVVSDTNKANFINYEFFMEHFYSGFYVAKYSPLVAKFTLAKAITENDMIGIWIENEGTF